MLLPVFAVAMLVTACGNDNDKTGVGADTGLEDTTMSNPTTNALDYHPDQRQQIPRPDSSNISGTDTISGTQATPNTGTQKSFNDQKGGDTLRQ